MNNTHQTQTELIYELKIRDALEHVRVRALEMQESTELGEVVWDLFEEVTELGFDIIRTNIQVHKLDQDVIDIWWAAHYLDRSQGVNYSRRQNISERNRFQRFQAARARGDRWHLEDVEVTQKQYEEIQTNRRSMLEDRGVSPEEIEQILKNLILPGQMLYVHGIFFSHGTVAFSSYSKRYGEDELEVLARFTEAFEFAYKRFLELEAKEEQNKALEVANRQLEEATRLKSQFLATMSHELRTPMNAIIGFTRLVLRRGSNLEDRQRENLEKVKLSADHLLNLINEILDLSKIEAGRIDIQPATFDLKMLIANCCATVGPTLGKPSVTLRYDVADDAVEVFSDEARLRQVVINLLSNALKFTDEGEVSITVTSYKSQITGQKLVDSEDGERLVTLDLRPVTDVLEIAVRDTGIGIPGDQLEAVFEEFRQVDGSSTRKIQGTGLGLAITKKLVELLGGSIGVSSVLGEGSTFTFRIPSRYGEAVDISSDSSTSITQVIDANNRLIVSIDDDPNVAVLLRQELEEDGYQVIAALNADEGIALVKKHKPVAVTVDILMPGKDGWQTIAALKADIETRDVPVIVVSAIENKELGFSMGIHDYIVKPFDHDALMGSLTRLNAHGMRDILVVEDEPSAADLLCQMLEVDGFTPRLAYNGRKALVCIEEKKPDAIFLDLMMPEMDGFEVIEQLQLREDWKRIPVIVVTAKDLTLEESDYLNARVNQVIQKGSLDSDVLENTLQDILDRYLDKK